MINNTCSDVSQGFEGPSIAFNCFSYVNVVFQNYFHFMWGQSTFLNIGRDATHTCDSFGLIEISLVYALSYMHDA